MFGLIGCGALACAAGEDATESSDALGDIRLGAPPPPRVPLAAPTSFTLSGPGCPEGSYQARVAEDGSLQIDFTKMEAWKDRATSCEVVLSLPDEKGVSYELTHYLATRKAQNYKTLESTHHVSSIWRNTEFGGALTAMMSGPTNSKDDDNSLGLATSPCSGKRELRVSSTLKVEKGESDESIRLEKLTLPITRRRCDEEGETAAAPSNPAPVATIRSVEVWGDGCPKEAVLASDGTSADVDLRNLSVSIAPHQSYGFRECYLTFKIDAPAGQGFALDSNQISGSALIPDGYEGWLMRKTDFYYFGRESVFRAGYQGSFNFTDRYSPDSSFASERTWPICWGHDSITIRLAAYIQKTPVAREQPAYLNVDSARSMRFALTPCPNTNAAE